MSKNCELPLGISTWSTAGLLRPEVKAALDGNAPCPPECEDEVRFYFNTLADTVLDSEVQTVEIWYSPLLWSEAAGQGLRRLAGAGKIGSMHAPFMDISSPDESVRNEGVETIIRSMELLAAYGGRILTTHGCVWFDDPAQIPMRIEPGAESIRKIADACAPYGIQVAVENLFPPQLWHDIEQIERMLTIINRPNVGICLDVNHVMPPDALIPMVKALGPRILTTHISDYDGVQERHWLPMEGIIDWKSLVRALVESGYKGAFVYETRFDSPGIPEAIRTVEENYARVMNLERSTSNVQL